MKNALLLFAAPLAFMAVASQANAAVIVDGKTLSGVGDSQTISFDGFEGIVIPGLTSTLTLTLQSLSTTAVTFAYSVLNTSSLAGSRVTTFGFNVDPDIASASSTNEFNTAVLNTQFPVNQVQVDACFSAGNTCQGGGGGGAVQGGPAQTGTLTLGFNPAVTGDITLSGFQDRYQGFNYQGIQSAVGRPTTPLPEPGTWAMMLIGFGAIGAFMRRRGPVGVKGRVSFA